VKIRNGKDFWAGLMFLGIGIGFMIVSRNYPMGTAVRMGPAYFPTVLGGIMAVLGAIIFLRAFISKIHHSIEVFPLRWVLLLVGCILAGIMYASLGWWAQFGKAGALIQYVLNASALFLIMGAWGPSVLFIILASVVIFGYLLKPLGLVIATGILIIMSAWGGHEFKLREAVISFVILAIFSVATFIYGLALPINIWPDLG
jgi:hypothetical protein